MDLPMEYQGTEKLMQFTIEGRPYFLNFVPDEASWFLYQATSHGVRRMPVIDDAAPMTEAILYGLEGSDEQHDGK
jgi:hypothetical protein